MWAKTREHSVRENYMRIRRPPSDDYKHPSKAEAPQSSPSLDGVEQPFSHSFNFFEGVTVIHTHRVGHDISDRHDSFDTPPPTPVEAGGGGHPPGALGLPPGRL